MILINTYKLFSNTAESLLEKDLVEMRDNALRTLKYIFQESDDEECYPSSLAWFGYEIALAVYGTVLSGSRYVRFRKSYDVSEFGRYSAAMHAEGYEMSMPPWVEDTDILTSHRSYLVRTGEKKYKKLFKGTPDWPVLWPVIDEDDITKYDLVVAKKDRKAAKSLPKSVRKRVSNV